MVNNQKNLSSLRESQCGRRGLLPVRSLDPGSGTGDKYLHVPVEVMDVKVDFGRMYFQVQPVNGAGRWWVYASRVDFDAYRPAADD